MAEFQTIRKSVTRDPRFGLGLAITGGIDAPNEGDPAIVISDVKENGPAIGKLKTGDRILSVNGISMVNVTHNQAIDALRSNTGTLDLIINRDMRQFPYQNGDRLNPPNNQNSHSSYQVSANAKLSLKGNSGFEVNRNLFTSSNPSSTLPGSEVFQSPLNSNEKRDDGQHVSRFNDVSSNRWEDLGLQLSSVIRVSSVDPSGLAYKEGIKPGDIILTLNGVEAAHLSLVDARKLLNREEVRMKLKRDEPSGSVVLEPYFRRTLGQPISYSDIPAATGRLPSSEHQMTASLQRPNQSKPSLFEVQVPSITLKSSHSKPDVSANSNLPAHQSLPQNHYLLEHPNWKIPQHIRRLTFAKDASGQTGVRLTGGNIVGIFIAGVHPSSIACQVGVKEGDRLLKVNGIDMYNKTHEEAVLAMVSAQSPLSLEISPDPDAFNQFLNANSPGDSFYIRTHFSYYPPDSANEIAFHNGDVFHIRDTLFGGCIGTWLALRIYPQSESMTAPGCIPNFHRAEQLALTAVEYEAKSPQSSGPKTKSDRFVLNTLRKRVRSTSSAIDSSIKSGLPAYEFVSQKQPDFMRPVVILGPLADVAKNRLIREHSHMFDGPQMGQGSGKFDPNHGDRITVRSIKDVINRGKHCVLDCSPESVELLICAQFAPIVIFLQPISKKQLTYLGSRHNQLGNAEQVKANWNYSKFIQTRWKHLYTEPVTLTNTDDWFSRVLVTIKEQQSSVCWMSTSKPSNEFDENEVVVFSRGEILRSSVPNLSLKTDFQLQNPPDKFRSNNSTSANVRLTRKHSFSDPNLERFQQSDREFRSDAEQFNQPPRVRADMQVNSDVHLRGHGRIDNQAVPRSGWVPPEMDLRAAREQYTMERSFSAGVRTEANINRGTENFNGPSYPSAGSGDQIFRSSNFIEFRKSTPHEDLSRGQMRQDLRYDTEKREIPNSKPENNRISYHASLNPPPRNGLSYQEDAMKRPGFGFEFQGGVDKRKSSGQPPLQYLHCTSEASGRFDHRGGNLDVYGTGVSLRIPQGALSYQANQTVFLKIYSDNNRNSGGDGLRPFMIMCGPPQLRFHQPVEVIVPVQRPDIDIASRVSSKWEYPLLHASLDVDNKPVVWSEAHINSSSTLRGVARKIDQNTLSVQVDHF